MRHLILPILITLSSAALSKTALAGEPRGKGPPSCRDAFDIDVVLGTYMEVSNSGDASRNAEILAPSYVNHTGLGDFGFDAYSALMGSLYSAFPDIHYTVEQVIVDGDQFGIEYSFTATHTGTFLGIPASGVVVQGRGMELHKVEDGMIVETWNYSDLLSLFTQIGAVPPLL